MDKTKIMQHMHELGLVPVLRASSAEEAITIADAILAGGVNILEVTMTVPGAIRVIEQLANHHGSKLLLGAGTVLDPETARNCILAGAQFVVSPALDLRTIELCRRYSVPIMPGALTPTEIVSAWQAGADVVKVFPCSALGGAKYLKALQGPLPQIQLIPTGGVSLATAEEFLAAGAFALGVGGDLVDAKAAREGRTSVITESAQKYVSIVKKFRSAS
ncbi:MAG TPA: bifunctional 2-keto-4-hydroxyglutarate aldolase/2-keto-3-deoxy-6-phosphogluconate aldolase [Acidobacteriaceae bacterium]|nr:bifunctional 2-keto-4-hydroxyglutarate aldolase/2-keto-3-deoxy-6-phosphogluconate aldolase [Acidobacteriaceae bacterium]